jgi:hypothetical protein
METEGWLPCSEERATCSYLNQINPVNASQFSLIKTHFNNMSFKWYLSFISSNSNLTSIFPFLCAPLYFVQFILREVIPLMMFSEKAPVINQFFIYAPDFSLFSSEFRYVVLKPEVFLSIMSSV